MSQTGHIIFSLLLLTSLFFISIKLFRSVKKYPGSDYLLFGILFLIFWIFAYIFFTFENRPDISRFLFLMQFFPKSFIFSSLAIFSIIHANPFYKFKTPWTFAFYIIPFLTMIFCFINNESGFIFNLIEIVQFQPYKTLSLENNFWFYIDLFYNVLVLAISFIILISTARDYTSIYKSKYYIYYVGYGIIIAGFILNRFDAGGIYDLPIILTSLGFFIIFWNIFYYKTSDMLIIAKDTVFRQITSACLIIDTNNKIADFNFAASTLFTSLGEDLSEFTFDEALEKLVELKDGEIKNEEGKNQEFQIVTDEKNIYYEIKTSSIIDDKNNNNKIGNFIEIRDITAQQELILELFKQANFDQLTDVYNRRYLDNRIIELNTKENHPIAVITGDLNKLKYINDTFGHKSGDRLIIEMANILKESISKNGMVVRFGGDEFVVVSTKTDFKQCEILVNKIKSNCKKNFIKPFGYPSISLGFAIKENVSDKFEDVLKQSDILMYEDKNKLGKTREARVLS